MSIIQGSAKQGSTRGFYPKLINGSLRLNDDDSAYLSWTPESSGSSTTWTYSGWIKRGNLGTSQYIFHSGDLSTTGTAIQFNSSNQIEIYYYSSAYIWRYITTAVFRDPSSWYHICVTYDSTNATASDRVKLYINGERVTAFSTATNPTLNQNTSISNSSYIHYISTPSNYFDGYLANVHFIDGQALTADDFGETKNGVWVAKDYAGTYGTNGFYLTFEDDTEVEAFNTVLYRGNGGTQSITGVGFKPDLVWIKNRDSGTYYHALFDSVRGTDKRLFSNTTDAENTTTNTLTSFDSDGFTLGSQNGQNLSGNAHVAWCWKAGDSNVSNTDGTITSTVRANPTYGFSIIDLNTPASGSFTVGHGLSSAPDFIILKRRDAGLSNWVVGHTSMGWDKYMFLQSTGGQSSSTTAWSNTAPTSSVINLDSSFYGGSANYICYCWSETTGYSKFGSYTGNGSTSGPSVTLGFRPAWLLIKRTDSASVNGWYLYDGTRNTTSPWGKVLIPSSSGAEGDNVDDIVVSDTGFTLNDAYQDINASGGTYIYAAFADTREAAFWLDQSGNDNDWQPVNLDHNDTVADSPTNNFATWNPLARNNTTYSDGNLTSVTTSNAAPYNILSTIQFPATGKWYAEVTATVGANNTGIGIGSNNPTDQWALYRRNGIYINGNISGISSSGTPATYVTSDVIGIAYDAEAGTLSFYKNGSAQTGGFTNIPATGYFIAIRADSASGDGGTLNAGQSGFTYTPPTGYLALSTANLPDPVIDPAQDASPEDYFNTVLYSGSSSAQSITGVGFQPDWTWIKSRSNATSHNLMDSVRGSSEILVSNSTNAEVTSATSFTSFDSDGFSVGTTNTDVNGSGRTYVAWNWKANGSGVTNTDGSITSTVSANTTSGFSIVSFTGDGSSSATVGHGLDTAPDMIIVKARSTTGNWYVYHSSMGLSKFLRLDTTDAQGTANNLYSTVNSTVFNPTYTGTSGITNIAYCFHSVEGFSKFGSYTGNGSADGTFVYTGFRPAWILWKRTDAAQEWHIMDVERNTYNPLGKDLWPPHSSAEYDYGTVVDYTSNGFKLRTSSVIANASGGTYIYMAFAETPFRYSLAR